MGNRCGWAARWTVAAMMVALIIGCSAGDQESPSAATEVGTPASVPELCQAGADQAVSRLEAFLASLPDITPEEFLDLDEIQGLGAFQDDIAVIIRQTTNQNSTLCNLDGFQELVEVGLRDVSADGVLDTFLLNTVRAGRELTKADLRVAPGDDVESVLGLLDHGSTLTFEAGTYELERPLLVQRAIALVGANTSDTVLLSSSRDAAIVIVGEGELTMRDMTVAHTGDSPASVVLSFDRPIDLAGTEIRGGVADDEGSAGNGVVLSDETFGGIDPSAKMLERTVISDSSIHSNVGAGIAVTGALSPQIAGSELRSNGVCGVCFFGAASGELVDSLVDTNEVGVQVSDSATPLLLQNEITASNLAGVVVVGSAKPTLNDNQISTAAEVAIAIQESASPIVDGNTIESVPVGISVLSDGDALVRANAISDIDVGVQVDENSAPTVAANTIDGSRLAGIAIRGTASGVFSNNTITPADGIGVVVEGSASPQITGLTVDGGAVGAAYTGSAAGTLGDARLSGQDIGIQIDEESAPVIENAAIDDAASAGIVTRGASHPMVVTSRISDSAEVAIATIDTSTPSFINNEFTTGQSGASIVGQSEPTISDNRFSDFEVGVQVGEDAAPMVDGNTFEALASAALVFVGNSTGEASSNIITDPGVVGIQLGDAAAPILSQNLLFASRSDQERPDPEPTPDQAQEPDGQTPDQADLEDEVADADQELDLDATVGILYAGSSGGDAQGNRLIGFVIGVQVGEQAVPTLRSNWINGGNLAGVGVLYRDTAAGVATDNETERHAVGFQISDQSSPVLEDNTVASVRNVAILVQGEAVPELNRNICPERVAGIGMLDGTDPVRADNECIDVIGSDG